MHDEKGSGNGDSPAAFIKGDPEASSLPESFSSEDLALKLREYLSTDPGSEIVLLTESIVEQLKYRFLPELGESIRVTGFFDFSESKSSGPCEFVTRVIEDI